MSIQEKLSMFSEAQALTSSADSQILDFGAGLDAWGAARTAPDFAMGKQLFVNVTVPEQLVSTSTSATLQIVLQTCATEDGSYTSMYSTAAIAESALTEGSRQLAMPLPLGLSRFNKLRYVVASDTFTSGAIDAWLGLEPVPVIDYP